MSRQIGFAVGVAVFVAVVGTPGTPAGRLAGFQHGWLVIAGTALAAGLAALALEAPAPRGRTRAGRDLSRGFLLVRRGNGFSTEFHTFPKASTEGSRFSTDWFTI